MSEKSSLNEQSSLGEWVGGVIGRARVLERLGLDYCCGGRKALDEACREKGLEVTDVIKQLTDTDPGELFASDLEWENPSLDKLCDHIEATHHAYLKQNLPGLQAVLTKVINAHGAGHPELGRLQSVFRSFEQEVSAHLAKEEQVLFPIIREMVTSTGPVSFHCGSVANPIRVMEYEHDNAGSALAAMRSLTSDYEMPADGCGTYKLLLDGLKQLEQDMHLHVHKENNILFPRAIALECQRVGCGTGACS